MPSITVFIKKKYFDLLWQLSKDRKVSISKIINEALKKYFEDKYSVGGRNVSTTV